MRQRIGHWLANLPATGRTGWLRGAIGAGLTIALTGLVGQWIAAGDPALPWLVASMGASSVLVLVLPASPLSQPWPVAAGHLIAAAMGLLCNMLVGPGWLGAGLAVGGAIAAMGLARCLHPPAGGTVLITALAAPASTAAGWHFLFTPLALNIAVLLLIGLLFNRLTGHSYPHRAAQIAAPAAWAGHIEDGDLDAVLAEWDEALDVEREDLLALIHAVEARVLARATARAAKR